VLTMPKWKYEEPSEEIKQLMKENGVSRTLFNYRTRCAKEKMSFREAATIPPRGKRPSHTGNSKYGKAIEEAEANGISRKNFYQRVNRYKMTVEKAKTKPLKIKGRLTEEEKEIAISNGITVEQAEARIRRGMPKEKAITKKMMVKTKRKHSIEIAESNGIQRPTFNSRILGGWNEYKARTYPVGSLECLTLRQNKLMLERGLSHAYVMNRLRKGLSPDEAIVKEGAIPKKKKEKKQDASLKRLRARINGSNTIHMVEVTDDKQTVFCGYAMSSDKVEVIGDTPAAIDNISCKWCKKYFEYGGR
jgi:hypothetical protein